jgi:hypothetical protein
MLVTVPVRLVREALEDPTTGVNAQLAALAPLAGDAIPEPIVRILSTTADDEVVSRGCFVDWPVLVVSADEPAVLNLAGAGSLPAKAFDVASLPITVLLVTRDQDTAAAMVATDYYLFAAALAIDAKLFAADAPAANRTRGPVTVWKRNAMTWGPLGFTLENVGRIAGALLCDVALRVQF